MRNPEDNTIQEQRTEFERKLEKTAGQIYKYAVIATILSVVTSLFFQIICILFTDKSLFSNDFLLSVLKIGIIAVVLMIVAIPEGLPLAVSIAMALSISRLKDDEILIKNLEAIQSAAMLHDLCVGKTGTLTKGDMNVSKYQLGEAFDKVHEHNRDEKPDNFVSPDIELNKDHKDFVIESILNNTDVRIETNDKVFRYEPKG